MVPEIDIIRFTPELRKLEFGNPEHIALSKERVRHLLFRTEKGSLKVRISDSIGQEIYLNPYAVFVMAKELELGNANVGISFLATLNSGMGQIKEGGLWDEKTEGVRNFEITLGLSGPPLKEYEVNSFERSLLYSVNHSFFHESQHLQEALLGLPNLERFKNIIQRMSASREEREESYAFQQTLPPEIFARKKMAEAMEFLPSRFSRKDYLLPVIID